MKKVFDYNSNHGINESVIATDLLNFQINRKITNISKQFLVFLEDLCKENVISDDYFNKQRKKILDLNGESIRELETLLNKFVFSFKKDNIG